MGLGSLVMRMRLCCRFLFFFFFFLASVFSFPVWVRWLDAMLMDCLKLYRRFLRARKFDINAAWTQFQETEDWRRNNALDKVYENIDVDSYEAARRMVPHPRPKPTHTKEAV